MALEVGPYYVDTKTVTASGTPEALTTREITCTSVFIRGLKANTGDLLLSDVATPASTSRIPSGGITLPVEDPRKINIDVSVSGEGAEWIAL